MSLLPCGYLGSGGKEEGEAQRKQEGREGRGKGGREGGKGGIKGAEGGGQGTQEKSESSTGLLPCPIAQCHPTPTLRTDSSQLTLGHITFTPLQSIVKLSSLSLSPYPAATAHTCAGSGGLDHRGLLSLLVLPIPGC